MLLHFLKKVANFYGELQNMFDRLMVFKTFSGFQDYHKSPW